jgi:hypothetical protein
MNYAERFFEIIRYVLEVANDPNATARPWAEVSQKIEDLFRAERDLPLPPKLPAEYGEEARVPIIIWIDEYLMTSKRPDALGWYEFSLQRRLLGTNNGGEMFYTNLSALLKKRFKAINSGGAWPTPWSGPETPEPDICQLWQRPGEGPAEYEGILDCFALCLVFGFNGRLASPDFGPLRKALGARAREQVAAWNDREDDFKAELRAAVKTTFLDRLKKFRAESGWILIHIIVPALVTLAVYLRSLTVLHHIHF